PQRRKYARCTASSSSPVPWAGFSPEAGPNRKTRQHTATRVWVTGADGSRTARTSEGLQLRTMVTEHDAMGRNHADRLAAVDGRAAGTRQAVGLRPLPTGVPGAPRIPERKANSHDDGSPADRRHPVALHPLRQPHALRRDPLLEGRRVRPPGP